MKAIIFAKSKGVFLIGFLVSSSLAAPIALAAPVTIYLEGTTTVQPGSTDQPLPYSATISYDTDIQFTQGDGYFATAPQANLGFIKVDTNGVIDDTPITRMSYNLNQVQGSPFPTNYYSSFWIQSADFNFIITATGSTPATGEASFVPTASDPLSFFSGSGVTQSVVFGTSTFDPSGVLSITSYSFSAPAAVPVPAAAWLFGSGLIGLTGLARKRKAV